MPQVSSTNEIYHRAAKGRGDKFDWSMTRGELITQYNTYCHFLFLF